MGSTSGFAHPQDNELITVQIRPALNNSSFVLIVRAGNWEQTIFVPQTQAIGLVKSLHQALFDLFMHPSFKVPEKKEGE